MREFGVLDLFKRCKAIAAEAHLLPSALAHVGIIWIVKFIEQDEVGDRIFAADPAWFSCDRYERPEPYKSGLCGEVVCRGTGRWRRSRR